MLAFLQAIGFSKRVLLVVCVHFFRIFISLPTEFYRSMSPLFLVVYLHHPPLCYCFFPFFSRLFGSRVAVQLAPLPIGWAVVDWSDWNYFFSVLLIVMDPYRLA